MGPFDYIILGNRLRGLMTACELQTQGHTCLYLPQPGPWHNAIHVLHLALHPQDPLAHWMHTVHIPTAPEWGAPCQKGDIAFTLVIPTATFCIPYTTDAGEIPHTPALSALLPLFTEITARTPPLDIPHLLKFLRPHSTLIPLGTFGLTQYLTRMLIERGGTVLPDISVSEIFMHHQKVQGVVLNHPDGLVWGHTVILNSFWENLIHLIPPSLRRPLKFFEKDFEPVYFYLQAESLTPARLPSSFAWTQFPLICVESPVESLAQAKNLPQLLRSTTYVFQVASGHLKAQSSTTSHTCLTQRTGITLTPSTPSCRFSPTLHTPKTGAFA